MKDHLLLYFNIFTHPFLILKIVHIKHKIIILCTVLVNFNYYWAILNNWIIYFLKRFCLKTSGLFCYKSFIPPKLFGIFETKTFGIQMFRILIVAPFKWKSTILDYAKSYGIYVYPTIVKIEKVWINVFTKQMYKAFTVTLKRIRNKCFKKWASARREWWG